MTTMTDTRITPDKLKTFPRAVAKVVMEAVNDFGVTYRVIDGGHIRLYCGNADVIPAKINHTSPEQHILRKLLPWLDDNVEGWTSRNDKPTAVAVALTEALARKEETDSPASSEPAGEQDGSTPDQHGFIIEDGIYKCVHCDHTQPKGQGRYLHGLKHRNPEEIRKMQKSAGEGRSLKHDQRVVMRREAVRVLAEQNGLVVFEKGQVDAKSTARLQRQVTELEAKVERLTAERDEARARLSLITEAMKA
jgi:hypothetical protein